MRDNGSPIRAIVRTLNDLWDNPVQGEIFIPRRSNGEFDSIKVVEEIVIAAPTREKIEAALREIWRSGFRGNVRLPREIADPFVIVKEEFRQVGRTLLTEAR